MLSTGVWFCKLERLGESPANLTIGRSIGDLIYMHLCFIDK